MALRHRPTELVIVAHTSQLAPYNCCRVVLSQPFLLVVEAFLITITTDEPRTHLPDHTVDVVVHLEARLLAILVVQC